MGWTTENKDECWRCNGTEPKYPNDKYCEDHNTCLSCGTHRKDLKDIPWGAKGGFICKPCTENALNNKIEAWNSEEHDLEYTDKAICPNCGCEHEADGEQEEFYMDGDHEIQCGECEYEFSMQTHVSISYSTFKN